MMIAVPAAVLGAAGFGPASAARQRATKEEPVAPTLSPQLLVELFARPMWLLGPAATIVALVLQVVAHAAHRPPRSRLRPRMGPVARNAMSSPAVVACHRVPTDPSR